VRKGWLSAWALGSVAFGGASLLVPLYIVELGGGPVALGILAATATAVAAPGAVVFGRLADRVGHRRPLVLGTLVAVAVALAAIPLLDDVWAVVAANALLWLFVGSVGPVLTTLVVEDAPESAWSARIGALNAAQGYGWAGGLVVGAVWPVVGAIWPVAGGVSWLFVVFAGCAAVSGAWAALALPRATAGPPTPRTARRVGRLLSESKRGVRGATFSFAPARLYWASRGVRLDTVRARLSTTLGTYLVAAGLFLAGSAAFWAPLPLFLTDAGFGAGPVFGLYLAASLASAVLYGAVGRLAATRDLRTLQTSALGARGVLFPAVVAVGGLGTVVGLGAAGVLLAAVGATWAVMLVVGTAIVTRLAPPSVRGELLGLHTAVGALAGGVGAVVGGWAASLGYLVAFGVAGGLVIAGGAVVWSLEGLSRRRSP
jgi:MFS family permease